MSVEAENGPPSARVIVVANEKGGSGKSTVAMHIAIALMKAGRRVATIDLDSQQQTFTHYIENRRAWAARIGRDLEIPNHVGLDEAAQDEMARRQGAHRRRRCPVEDLRFHRHRHARLREPAHARGPCDR